MIKNIENRSPSFPLHHRRRRISHAIHNQLTLIRAASTQPFDTLPVVGERGPDHGPRVYVYTTSPSKFNDR